MTTPKLGARGRAVTTTPGDELKDNDIRDMATTLVRDWGWTYQYIGVGKKPKLFNPDGQYTTLPTTPSSYGSVLRTRSRLKRLGARLDEKPPPRRRHLRPAPEQHFEPVVAPWTDSEWRDKTRCKQCGSDLRYGAWDAEFCSVDCAEAARPKPPPKPVISAHGRALLDRLDRGVVAPSAQGKDGWTLAAARDMLRQGYSLPHVCRLTGWGSMWLDDLAARLNREEEP